MSHRSRAIRLPSLSKLSQSSDSDKKDTFKASNSFKSKLAETLQGFQPESRLDRNLLLGIFDPVKSKENPQELKKMKSTQLSKVDLEQKGN